MKDVLPPLDRFDYEKLAHSILHEGVQEPIVVNEYDVIIDGENRKEIADRFDMPCPKRVVTGLTPQEMRDLCVVLNAARRQLSIEQRREVWRSHRGDVKHLLTEQPTRSDRSIGEQLGVHHSTVAKDREDLESSGELATTEYKPSYGGGERVERDPREIPAENFADHRNEVYLELTFGYPAPSAEIRRRGEDPYPQASDRLTWPSGRLYLTSPAPSNENEAAALLAEGFQRVSREMASRPLKTMSRARA